MEYIATKIFAPLTGIWFQSLLFVFFFRLSDINIFQQVLQHPEYKKNPTSTIQEHLNNRLIVEEQNMDTT